MSQRLTVCYFGTYRANYARNQIMIAGLRAAGVTVIECHMPLWKGVEDRVRITQGGWASLSFASRILSTYTQLLLKYFRLKADYDVMVLGYPGQIDVFLARLLTRLKGKPLVIDILMSVYLVAVERNLLESRPITRRVIRFLEGVGGYLPDLLIFNTKEYINWYHKTYNICLSNSCLVPMGVDDRVFRPVEVTRATNGVVKVLYYGTFIQNHGVEYIIEAANLLRDKEYIHFELIGSGPTRNMAQTLVNKYQLKNVTFTGWVEKDQLPVKIAAADICLGVFSFTPQSYMTVHNKIYEGLAMRKAVVTGDSPTIRETFQHKTHLYLVERANPRALADALLTLQANPDLRARLAEEGHRKVANEFSTAALGQILRTHLETLIKKH